MKCNIIDNSPRCFRMQRVSLLVLSALFSLPVSAVVATSAMTNPIQGRAPVASSTTLMTAAGPAASAVIGEEIFLSYSFTDNDLDAEMGSEFTWQARSADEVEFTSISGATNKNWIATAGFVGHDVRACVIPRTDESNTLPSRGERVCSSPIPVILARPTVSDVRIALKTPPEASTGLMVGATLEGTYTWSAANVGGNKSRYAWGHKGRTAKSLNTITSGKGVNTDGSIDDYTIDATDAGMYLELSVLPVTDIGPTQGSVVTSASLGPVINPSSSPIASSLSRPTEEFVARHITETAVVIPEGTYQFDSNGGYAGDQSRYTVEVLKSNGERVVVESGVVTRPGVIPTVTVPKGTVPGTLVRSVTPVNGKGVKGNRIEQEIGTMIDPTVKPVLKSLSIANKEKPWAPGDTLTATADVDFGINPPSLHRSKFLWRVQKGDSDMNKLSELNTYGALTSSHGVIAPRTLVAADAGVVIELLYQPKILMADGGTLAGDGVAVDAINDKVAGDIPIVTVPDALPEIAELKLNQYKVNTNPDGDYVLDTKGGYYIDISEVSSRLMSVRYGVLIDYGRSRVVTPGKLPIYISGHSTTTDTYLEITVTPKTRSLDGLVVMEGKPVTYGLKYWQDMGYGLNGSGYLYHWGGITSHPSIGSGSITFSLADSAAVMQPGVRIEAAYRAEAYPVEGTTDTSKYTWQRGRTTEQKGVVKDLGKVPHYVIQEQDVGHVVELALGHCLSGVVVPANGVELLSCSSVTEKTTIDIVEAAPESEFELTHNSLGYTYLPDGDGPTTSDAGRLHSWGSANTGCQDKGLGWRLPTVAELTAISGPDFTRPASWPSGHTYWSSEAVAGTTGQHKTVYIANKDSVGEMRDDSYTTAVCVKMASSS